MNRINNSDEQRYYQILQELGINKDVSSRELTLIFSEVTNEASEAYKLNKPSYDELSKKAKMLSEAVFSREYRKKWENKNLSITRYYQALGLSKNITLEEALRISNKLTEEHTEASVASYETGDDTIFGRANIKCQMINEIVDVLYKEKYGEKKEVKIEENDKQIEVQKELNNALQEGIVNGEGVDNEKVSKAVRQIASVNQEIVKKTAEIVKHSENRNIADNDNKLSTSTEKDKVIENNEGSNNQKGSNQQSENNNLSSDPKAITQGNGEGKGDAKFDENTLLALIVQLKKEIAELKKKLDPNNVEQKAFLASKEEKLAKLESVVRDNSSQKNETQATKPNDNSWKSRTLIAGGIGGGVVLLGLVAAIMIKNKKKKLK